MIHTALLALTLMAAIPAHAQPENVWAEGTAYLDGTDNVLYRESHYRDSPEDPLPTRVLYTDPRGEPIAEKRMDFSSSLLAPSIEHHDRRTGARIDIDNPGPDGGIHVTFRDHEDDELEETRFEAPDSLIIDAGFNAFVQRHWQALVDGERLTSHFLVPSRMDMVRIGIRRTDRAECETPAEPVICFKVSPAGLLSFVGWFTRPVLLAYHTGNRRLMMFEGTSYIPDAEGNDRRALIRYEYP